PFVGVDVDAPHFGALERDAREVAVAAAHVEDGTRARVLAERRQARALFHAECGRRVRGIALEIGASDLLVLQGPESSGTSPAAVTRESRASAHAPRAFGRCATEAFPRH